MELPINIRKKRFGFVFLFCVIVLMMILAFYVKTNDTSWKIFETNISWMGYNKLSEKYEGFIGCNIEKVIELLANSNENRRGYLIIKPGVTWNGNEYYEVFIKEHPEIELTGNREALYCFPVYNSHSPEEIIVVGFFTDENDVVIEKASSLSAILW